MRRVLSYRRKGWVLSGQAGAFIPGSVENGFDKPLGQRGMDWEVRALAGRSFQLAQRHGFADVQIAFRERSHGSGNEVRLDTTLGRMMANRMQFLIQSNIVVGLPSARENIRTVDSIKGQVSAIWYFTHIYGVQFSVAKTLVGRNVVNDTGFTVGLWRRF